MLLLAIFAAATQTWVLRDCGRGLFSTCAEANKQSIGWIKAVEDVLDISHRTSSVPIEGIQAISIASFVLLNMEGFTRRTKALFNMALNLSRDLGLHYLDHPSNAQSANSAQTEIGRRVWWYLVATDWIIPAMRFNGGLQGYYNCHPRHMLVRKPLNVNDEDVIDGMSCIDQPLSQPTTMSFTLQRLRSSEISRRMVDRTPLMMGRAGGPSHDVVMDIDTEYQTLLNDTPPFFSMPVADLTTTYQLSPSRAANIAHQGYMLYSLIHAQRCTLHFPYFSRSFADPAYASSRDICLRSARLVIQTESQLENSKTAATRYRFLAFLVAVFMASIVVLMDLCYDKAPCQQEQHRGELAEAIRILEQARHESETAARFLDSLMHILRKHKVLPPKRTQLGWQVNSFRVG
ncbi:putative transcription factor lepB [Lachnellula hyalina]|uniref:Putative transcription factor lepB n=1 Tax=Lachnellula hyalina TaxID=1316788 RepID=A0A8H8R8P3_9HELO|nr:putative transcription factor lepB [Lachnellula hyalina]TVY30615.1 putative transcription factor lepB [Lachnellula hyalina]